jgi:hypothetical protein
VEIAIWSSSFSSIQLVGEVGPEAMRAYLLRMLCRPVIAIQYQLPVRVAAKFKELAKPIL